MNLAAALREYRRGMTVQELAHQLRVSQQTIRNWEAGGNRPRPKTRETIGKALGVPADQVANGHASLPLEDLLRAIQAKGFDVHIRPRRQAQ